MPRPVSRPVPVSEESGKSAFTLLRGRVREWRGDKTLFRGTDDEMDPKMSGGFPRARKNLTGLTVEDKRERERMLGRERARRFRERQKRMMEAASGMNDTPLDKRLQRKRELGRERTRRWREKKNQQRKPTGDNGQFSGIGDDVPLTRLVQHQPAQSILQPVAIPMQPPALPLAHGQSHDRMQQHLLGLQTQDRMQQHHLGMQSQDRMQHHHMQSHDRMPPHHISIPEVGSGVLDPHSGLDGMSDSERVDDEASRDPGFSLLHDMYMVPSEGHLQHDLRGPDGEE